MVMPHPSAEAFECVARTGKLQDGEMLLVSAGGQEIVLARVGGEYLAVDSVCTHALGYLDQGTLSGCEIECPLHGGRFDLRTGEATQEPATDPLITYQVRVQDGDVLVGPPKPT